jgi:uncharacterized membrane protein
VCIQSISKLYAMCVLLIDIGTMPSCKDCCLLCVTLVLVCVKLLKAKNQLDQERNHGYFISPVSYLFLCLHIMFDKDNFITCFLIQEIL